MQLILERNHSIGDDISVSMDFVLDGFGFELIGLDLEC